jgi:hypothetical protein
MNDYADLIVQLRSGEIGYELAAADALAAQANRIDYLEHVVDSLRDRLGSSLEYSEYLRQRHFKMQKALEKIIKKAKASGHEKIVKKAEAILEDYDD